MRWSLLAACLLLAVAGCGKSAAGPKLSETRLERLVLQEQDLPGYEQFSAGREALSELSPVFGRDATKFGRQNGWTARYRRSSARGRGALTVSSITDVFARDADAQKFLDAVREKQTQTGSANGLKTIQVSDLGEEAVGLATETSIPGGVRSVQLTWRVGRFVATLAATGYTERMTVADVVGLARKQQRRLS